MRTWHFDDPNLRESIQNLYITFTLRNVIDHLLNYDGRTEVGQGRNKQKRHVRGVATDQGRGGQGRNKQKCHVRGVTTDLLDV